MGESSVDGSPIGHAFLWQDGTMFDLGVLDDGSNSSWAQDINNQGLVVGRSYSSTSDSAIIWDSVNGMLDLETLLDSSGSGWELHDATSISENGYIVGWGTNPDGESHAHLLTPNPVPEPSAIVLWAGLATIMGATRLRRGRTPVDW